MTGVRPKSALAALREGRVTIKDVFYAAGPKATFVDAIVHGHQGRHRVERYDDRWLCDCNRPMPCAHILAVALVTGHGDTPELGGDVNARSDVSAKDAHDGPTSGPGVPASPPSTPQQVAAG